MPEVVCFGKCFMDLLFTGLPGSLRPGVEIYASGLGLAPGGTANVATALSRLGLQAGLISTLGTDVLGDLVCNILTNEGVDLSAVRRDPRTCTAVSVSLSYSHDRAIVTYEEPFRANFPSAPSDYWTEVQAFFHYVGPGLDQHLLALYNRGITLFGDAAWDPGEEWREEHLAILPCLTAFMPNEVEALAYARTSSVQGALDWLAERTPTVVIKRGPNGAIARRGGELVTVPAPAVEVVDTTGAGDVFNAGFMTGNLAGWPLSDCVRLGCLAASVSVTRHSGSLGAPTWDDLHTFIAQMPTQDRIAWQHLIEKQASIHKT